MIRARRGTLCIAKDLKRPQTDSEEPDQPVRMRMLIGVFARRTCNLIGNAVLDFYNDAVQTETVP